MSTTTPTPQKLLELVDQLERDLGDARTALFSATARAEQLEFLTEEAGGAYAEVAELARAMQEVLPEDDEAVDVEAAIAGLVQMRERIESARGHGDDLAWALT